MNRFNYFILSFIFTACLFSFHSFGADLLEVYLKNKEDHIKFSQKSFKDIKTLATEGDPFAQLVLAKVYQEKERYKDAIEWYEKSAQQGNVEAQIELATIYRNGKKSMKDNKKATQWLEKVMEQAEKGDHISEFELALLHYTRLKKGKKEMLPHDYKKAFDLFDKLANRGYPPAKYYLGWMHYHGLGVEEDKERATRWLSEASKEGILAAKEKLIRMHLKNGNEIQAGILKKQLGKVRMRQSPRGTCAAPFSPKSVSKN